MLGATSPRMTGNKVKNLQRRLSGKNHFKRNFEPGEVDGIFGGQTAAAVKRAKMFMGYPRKSVNGMAGSRFRKYLSGSKRLPLSYRHRKNRRLRARPKAEIMRHKVLAVAKAHLGVQESPANSNIVKFSTWYGMTGPWCAMFVTYCYVKAGSKSFVRGKKYAYVPYLTSDAVAGRGFLTTTRNPSPGDLVTYDWQGDGVDDHVGIFVKWTDQKTGKFIAYEGNTSLHNNSNGGGVMERSRSTSMVSEFITVKE